MGEYSNAGWLGAHLNEGQTRCLDTLCSIERAHNLAPYLMGETNEEKFVFNQWSGLSVKFGGLISTFDDDKLTRLVLAAHENAVRVEIAPHGPTSFQIALSPRERKGSMFERHPSIEDVLGSN